MVKAARTKAKDLLLAARLLQEAIDERGLGRRALRRAFSEMFDEVISNDLLRGTTRRLFMTGHYAQAVEEAFKCVDNYVKSRSNRNDLSGSKLMSAVFNPTNPVLKLNSLVTQSEKDEQNGYMQLFVGCMIGIRNPRAHEHGFQDEAHEALELIVLAQHLLRVAQEAELAISEVEAEA